MISATVYSGNTHFQASIYLFFNSCAVLFLNCGEAEADETLTASENEDEPSSENASENEVDQTKGEEDMDTADKDSADNEGESEVELCYGPETRDQCTERLKLTLKAEFDEVNGSGKKSKMFMEHGKQKRAIIDVDLILQLFQNNCQIHLCTGQCSVASFEAVGGVLKITWECSNGHSGVWTSSKVLCKKKGQDVYSNTMMIAAAIFITGNSYEKFSLLCKFLRLSSVSKSTFMRIQKKYIIPEIKKFWKDMKASVWKIFKGESIILCGDGRNDSPGHSAKYCVYVLMEQFVSVVVDIDVVDKRETGGVSTNMEVFGLKRLLERVVGEIIVSEIVTDASTSVIALVRKLKGKIPVIELGQELLYFNYQLHIYL